MLSLARFRLGLLVKVGTTQSARHRDFALDWAFEFETSIRDRDRLMSDNSHPVFSASLVQMIRCPVTKSDLTVASEQAVSDLNERIGNRTLLNQIGQVIEEPIESGFINQDGSLLLPVRGGIVILVVDQAIPIGQSVA